MLNKFNDLDSFLQMERSKIIDECMESLPSEVILSIDGIRKEVDRVSSMMRFDPGVDAKLKYTQILGKVKNLGIDINDLN